MRLLPINAGLYICHVYVYGEDIYTVHALTNLSRLIASRLLYIKYMSAE